MRKLYITAKAHMDPAWRRCFEDHFEGNEWKGVVRPYSELEEKQVLEYMDLAEKYGVKYQIEQSITVRKVLELNPDIAERFKDLVKRGLIELPGGGECVIDYTLSCGESWVRNHLYNVAYYREQFGMKPRYAITPDIFGLPSQLPQFFRSVGYDALILYDRVMLKNKPYWKGLDGTLIVLDDMYLRSGDYRAADCVQMKPCEKCLGEGCPVCRGWGYDPSWDMSRRDKKIMPGESSYWGNISGDEFFEKLLEKEDKEEYYVNIVTEEARVGKEVYGPLLDRAAAHGFEIHFLTFSENHDRWCPGQVQRLREGKVTPEEIDPRTDDMPVSAGCYASRIETKKANFELEQLLKSAEELATLAYMHGGYDKNAIPRRYYPSKKLGKLWEKMSFIQFHDNLPGSNCDGSVEELRRIFRKVRVGAWDIANEAAAELFRSKCVKGPKGCAAAAALNPCARKADTAYLVLSVPYGVENVDIFDEDGKKLTSSILSVTHQQACDALEVCVFAEVPAAGYRVFFWKQKDAPCVAAAVEGKCIENEYYRVEWDEKGIKCVFDKETGKNALRRGAGMLSWSDDHGSVWGRVEKYKECIALPVDKAEAESFPGGQRLRLAGSFADANRSVRKLDYKIEVTLNEGEKLVRFKTTVDWDGDNARIFAKFPMAFDAHAKFVGEEPFGMQTRNELANNDNCMGLRDEYATQIMAGCEKRGYAVAVLKKGLPGTHIEKSDLFLTILRATVGTKDYVGANEKGVHVCEYAVTTLKGSMRDARLSAEAEKYAARTVSYEIPADQDAQQCIPACGQWTDILPTLPGNVRVSALKLSEDGKDIVLRVWENTGKQTKVSLPGHKVVLCNSLEEIKGRARKTYALHPFEIATFRLKKD